MENANAQVAIKSNGKLSTRVNIKELIMQGSIWGSICCVVLMDKLGKIVYRKPELLYYYKGIVGIPQMQMIDDVLGIQNCSRESQKLNSTINTFINLEKLKLSEILHKASYKYQYPTCTQQSMTEGSGWFVQTPAPEFP